jgi:hypothetical protein
MSRIDGAFEVLKREMAKFEASDKKSFDLLQQSITKVLPNDERVCFIFVTKIIILPIFFYSNFF